MNKTVVGVILARGGSKGIPRKNLQKIGGTPLIQRIYEASRRSKHMNRVVISTEDDEIASFSRGIGIEVPFIRPKALATDAAPGIDVIKHALAFFHDAGYRVDAMISLQPTNPFTKTETIDQAIEIWESSGCDSVTTIAEVTKGHPYITKRCGPDHRIENFVEIPAGVPMGRRQDREKAFYLTGGIYLRSRAIIEAEKMDSHYLGRDARAVVVDEVEAFDINDPFDLEFAEFIAKRNKL